MRLNVFKNEVVKKRQYVVAVSDGVGIKEFETTNRYAYNCGTIYEYKDEKGQLELVAVPSGYRYGEVNGSLIIGKNLGNSSAATLVRDEFLIGKSVDRDCPGSDLAMLVRTHVAAMGWKTVNEKSVPWKMLIIGIAILVVVVGVVWLVRSQGA